MQVAHGRHPWSCWLKCERVLFTCTPRRTALSGHRDGRPRVAPRLFILLFCF